MSTQGQFKLSSTRGKSEMLHVARIRKAGVLVGECYPARLDGGGDKKGFSDPMKFIRQYPDSFSHKAMVAMLKRNKLTNAEIDFLMAFPTEQAPKLKKPRKNKQN
jgi:hypothetical protein